MQRGPAAAALVGVALSLVALGFHLSHLEEYRQKPAWNPNFRADAGLAPLVKSGDGIPFYLLADDPTLARPEALRSPEAAAYRAQRMVPAWLIWAFGAGRPAAFPWVMLGLMLFGVGLACYWGAKLLASYGAPPLLGASIAIFPGALATYGWLGPELLGLGLLLAGVVRDDVRLHALAGLFRESLLIPSLVLLVLTRRIRYAVPLAVFATWALIVRVRVGAWFFEANAGRLGVFESPVIVAAMIALILVLLPKGGRLGFEGLTLFAYVALAAAGGSEVWSAWQHISRPMMPAMVLALGLAVRRLAARRSARRGEIAPVRA